MKMVFRWWPHGDDTVTLKQIRQIPGVSGVATMLPHIPAGQVWPKEDIRALAQDGAGGIFAVMLE